ncbi:MAG: enoyl-CoA hydratase/isomerase family protein [Chloroflexota bacterium]|nr:enoyl-CoA hydratase/isomerase family protein [Chloroflexota bacterium]
MDFETLRYAVADGVALITLDRPESLNAVNETMREELASLPPLLQETAVQVVVFTGAGRAFCAGGDIAMFEQEWRTPEFRSHSRILTGFYDFLERLEKPVIAAINGVATGAGFQLALSCDLRFAAESARVGFRENFIGLIPAVGGITRTVRLVGPAVTKELIFSADLIDATTAHAHGLVNRVYADDKLLDATLAFAEQLTRRAPQALGLAKLLVNEAQNIDLHTGRTLEALAQSILLETQDHAEGIQAFRDKRKPNFTGR